MGNQVDLPVTRDDRTIGDDRCRPARDAEEESAQQGVETHVGGSARGMLGCVAVLRHGADGL
jgi:hypothetical protein